MCERMPAAHAIVDQDGDLFPEYERNAWTDEITPWYVSKQSEVVRAMLHAVSHQTVEFAFGTLRVFTPKRNGGER